MQAYFGFAQTITNLALVGASFGKRLYLCCVAVTVVAIVTAS